MIKKKLMKRIFIIGKVQHQIWYLCTIQNFSSTAHKKDYFDWQITSDITFYKTKTLRKQEL